MARPRSALTKFILSLPRALSVKDVIARAKANGLKASEGNVYRVRRIHGGKAARTSKPLAARNGAFPPATTSTSSAEDLLRALAAEIGLGRAVEILAADRARVRAAIGE